MIGTRIATIKVKVEGWKDLTYKCPWYSLNEYIAGVLDEVEGLPVESITIE